MTIQQHSGRKADTGSDDGGQSSFPPCAPPHSTSSHRRKRGGWGKWDYEEMRPVLHLPRLLRVGAPILQQDVLPMHFAGIEKTCNKPCSGCVNPRQCPWHAGAFFKAALFTMSNTAATSQKHLLKNVTSYLNTFPLTVYEF